MKKILVIEDDSLIASIYKNQLERAGFSAFVACDGEEGLAKVEELRPDGVLLDLMLPKISGLDFIRNIRSQEIFKNLPVIVFSNSFVPNLFQKAKEAGATKVFNKASTKPSELISAIKAECMPEAAANGPNGAPPGIKDILTSLAPPKPVDKTPPPSAAEVETDTAMHSQSDLRTKLLADMPERLLNLRRIFQDSIRIEKSASLPLRLNELCRLVHVLTGQAGIVGLNQTAQFCSALEALLKELHEKPKYINPSSLRTVAQGMDLLDQLIKSVARSQSEAFQPALILVVDDDIISRQTVCSALKKANLKSVSVEEPEMALKLCRENRFDLVLSDVEMPVMNGFEMCKEIHSLPENEKTPFIFVTSLTDFESRTRSILSGGNDLIGKPFLLIELAVKALTQVLKSQLAAPAD